MSIPYQMHANPAKSGMFTAVRGHRNAGDSTRHDLRSRDLSPAGPARGAPAQHESASPSWAGRQVTSANPSRPSTSRSSVVRLERRPLARSRAIHMSVAEVVRAARLSDGTVPATAAPRKIVGRQGNRVHDRRVCTGCVQRRSLIATVVCALRRRGECPPDWRQRRTVASSSTSNGVSQLTALAARRGGGGAAVLQEPGLTRSAVRGCWGRDRDPPYEGERHQRPRLRHEGHQSSCRRLQPEGEAVARPSAPPSSRSSPRGRPNARSRSSTMPEVRARPGRRSPSTGRKPTTAGSVVPRLDERQGQDAANHHIRSVKTLAIV